MNKIFKKLTLVEFARLCFYLFVFFLPFQINAILVTADIFALGFFNPYLSHFVYLSDLFLIVALMFFSFALIFSSDAVTLNFDFKNKKFLYLLVSLFILSYFISLFFSVNFLNSFVYIIRIFEFLVVFLFIASGFMDFKKIMYVFIGNLCIIAFLGIFQYLIQSSLGFRFLGEPVISSNLPGVAKVELFDKNILRVYGTFPHPNIFAGYLLFAMFFIVCFFRKAASASLKVLLILILTVMALAFVFTFSRSAFLALCTGLLFYYVLTNKQISIVYFILAISLILFFIVVFDLWEVLLNRAFLFDEINFDERYMYLSISKNMFLNNIFGVGAGNFTAVMQDFIYIKLMPWLFQPVHNSFLLVFNELGIFGGIIFLGILLYHFFYLISIKSSRFVVVLIALWSCVVVISLFDHYFISLYQGQALLWIFFGMVASPGILSDK